MKTESPIEEQARDNKKTYATPKLVSYGDVRLLTQTGSKSGNENAGNTGGSQ